MALFYGDSNIIPRAISASTEKALERKIHNLQLKKGMEYKFISFYYDSNRNRHVGWYYALFNEIEELLTGDKDATIEKRKAITAFRV